MKGEKLYEEYIQQSQHEIANVGTEILKQQRELGKIDIFLPLIIAVSWELNCQK